MYIDLAEMQMTASPTMLDNVDLNNLVTGMGTTMDHFLTDFRDEKALMHFIGKMISENIAGSIVTTQTQRQQWYKAFNTGCSLMVTN